VIDSHAHLTMFPKEERSEILRRAFDAGVQLVLAPATGPEDLAATASLPHEHAAGLAVALGFHPHEARHLDDGWKRRLERALEGYGVVAVGEVGLDYHYMNSPKEDQRRALAWQLALAKERGLPVILHHREAWDDFLAALDAVPGVHGVAHSFTEGEDGVRAMAERGLHVGISGMVTFPRADNVHAAARAVPDGRLLVETDAPFLTPVPHRGTRNEPSYVPLVAAEAARLRGVEVGELERLTDEAFGALFGVARP
jgi:TatD DNase family protein